MPTIDTLAANADQAPDHEFVVSGHFILAVRDLRDAAQLVVKSDGAYDLEYLDETINNLEG